MDAAVDSLYDVVPRVKVAGQLTVHAIDSVPLPILAILFVVGVALFRWPFAAAAAANPPLPVAAARRGDAKDLPHLVPLPACRPRQYTYLDTLTRQLVVSEKPLLPPTPRPPRKDRCGRLRAALRGYRPPLNRVPEDAEEHPMTTV